MNFGFLFLFLLIQVVVNNVLSVLLEPILNNTYGVLAYCLLASMIIAFFGALLNQA